MDRNRADRQRLSHDRTQEDRYTASDRVSKSRVTTGDVPPRPPPTRSIQLGSKAPAVNRDLKPSRLNKTSSDGRSQLLRSADKDVSAPQRAVRHLLRDQMKLPPLPGHEISHQQNQCDVFPPSRRPPASPQLREHSNSSTQTESSPNGKETQSSARQVKCRPSFSSHGPQRFSLDLESQDLESDSERENSSADFRKQQNHEWPPAKADLNPSSYSGHSKPAEGLEEQNWYVGAFSRVEAEHALHLVNQEGAFLVRDCSKNTTHEPFVLAVFYDKRVFNIQIRFSEDSSKYTLGTGLRTNDRFDSVTDIIKFHSIFPIVLIDGRKNTTATNQRRHCVLMYPITKKDMTTLLN